MQEADRRQVLAGLIAGCPTLLGPLRLVAALELPDAWIGAGLLRDAVWDRLSGGAPRAARDIDVVWHDPARASAAADARLARRLRGMVEGCDAQWTPTPALPRVAGEGGIRWCVTNQARMHARNGDAPYADTAAALACWPETATAVAARIRDGQIEILAPHGLADLFGMVVRPTPRFAGDPAKLAIVRRRVAEKAWLSRWPGLTCVLP